jgi:hypothetical protein
VLQFPGSDGSLATNCVTRPTEDSVPPKIGGPFASGPDNHILLSSSQVFVSERLTVKSLVPTLKDSALEPR